MTQLSYSDVIIFGVGIIMLLNGRLLYAIAALGLGLGLHVWHQAPRT